MSSVGQPLSDREKRIVRLVAQGVSRSAIAERLGSTPNSISGQLSHICEKLNLESNRQIAEWVRKNPSLTGPSVTPSTDVTVPASPAETSGGAGLSAGST